jgi:hypothetical protein
MEDRLLHRCQHRIVFCLLMLEKTLISCMVQAPLAIPVLLADLIMPFDRKLLC